MQRYFYNADMNTFFLSHNDSHHIIKVMRYSIGDEIEVVMDKKVYVCEIMAFVDGLVQVSKKSEIKSSDELSCEVTIAQSLVKEQKMDFILQKCCELGVKTIIPLSASRSVVKLDKKETKKNERWQKIVKEASEQSKRLVIPDVLPIFDIDDLLKLNYDIKILCTVNELSNNIKKVLSKELNGATIIFVIGPEGGFTEEEETKLIKAGYVATSLGSRVLRTETASMYALSIVNYILMR